MRLDVKITIVLTKIKIKIVMYLQVIHKSIKTKLCSSSIVIVVANHLNSVLNNKLSKKRYMYCLTQDLMAVSSTINGLFLKKY